MTEKQYMRLLRRELRRVSPDDRDAILADCREHFARGRESGQTEEGLARSLGHPSDVAAAAVTELGDKKQNESTAKSVLRISIGSLAILLFNLIFILGPYLGLVGGMIGLWAGALAIAVSGAAVALAVPLEPVLEIWIRGNQLMPMEGFMIRVAQFFGGIACVALGLLAVMGMILLTRLFIRGTAGYATLMYRIAVR